MSDQLKSLKQLIKHAVNPVTVVTNDLLAQQSVRSNTSPIKKHTLNNIRTPSPKPKPSFVKLNATRVEDSRAEVNQLPVEPSRQTIKPIPRPRVNNRNFVDIIEVVIDTEINFTIRQEVLATEFNMEEERIYLRTVIAAVEQTEVADRTPKQKFDLKLYQSALLNLVPIVRPKPELGVVARPGVKFNRDGLPKSFKTGMDSEEHVRQFNIYCATNGYKESDEKMAIFSMTLAKLEADWYETCSSETIVNLLKEFEERFGTTDHRSKARRDFVNTTWIATEKPSTFLMKLRILGSKAKETTDTIKDKFMDGLGVEIRSSLITHAESDAELIAKYADLLWEMKTPATTEIPLAKEEPSALTETLSTILSYVKQEKSENQRGRDRYKSSDSTKRYDSRNKSPRSDSRNTGVNRYRSNSNSRPYESDRYRSNSNSRPYESDRYRSSSNNSRQDERRSYKSPSNRSHRDNPKSDNSPRKDRTPRNDRRSSNDSYRHQSRDRYRQNRSPSIHEPTCHGCGVKGHYIAKCPDAPDRCTACKGLYHTIDECPVEIRKTRPITKKPNRRRSRDDDYKDKRNSRKPSLHLSKREPETSGSESTGSEN
jgi:hypothetical protein